MSLVPPNVGSSRYVAAGQPSVAEGWVLERITPPSRLFGANGLRTAPDGRILVAQVTGSQISALEVETGELSTISAKGGDIVAPDDLAFSPAGDLYVTEVMDGRVSVVDDAGRGRVLRADIPSANGITFHQGRLFVGEFRESGRILELDLSGGEPRVLLENVPMPNAMEVGPDGFLYFPVLGANEIWRVHPDGGAPETVAADLGLPDAVKFDSKGHIVTTQIQSGQVLRVDPRNGERTVLAALHPGLDNLAFLGERLFVSSFTGEITEILPDGTVRTVLPGGLNGPLDLTVSANGDLYVSDGSHLYSYHPQAESGLRSVAMLFTPGYPGFLRGLTASGPGELTVTTTVGQVSRYRPQDAETELLAEGFDQLYGIAVTSDGAAVVAELGAGRLLAIQASDVKVLASGLNEPVGVAVTGKDQYLVSEAGAGRVVRVTGSGVVPVIEGLERPHGILVRDGRLYVVDAGAQSLVVVDLETGARSTIASELPAGVPPGVVPKPLRGIPPFTGPQGPFAGIAAAPDGTLYVSADAEGSVLALHRLPSRNDD